MWMHGHCDKAALCKSGESGPGAYVLRNRLPDDLRTLCVQPPRATRLNHALAMVLLQLIRHSGHRLLEGEHARSIAMRA